MYTVQYILLRILGFEALYCVCGCVCVCVFASSFPFKLSCRTKIELLSSWTLCDLTTCKLFASFLRVSCWHFLLLSFICLSFSLADIHLSQFSLHFPVCLSFICHYSSFICHLIIHLVTHSFICQSCLT